MVKTPIKRCSHESCMRPPSFNFEGSKPGVYCNRHAQDDMVHARDKRCSYDACSRQPSFNIRGRKMGVYCKQHTKNGMVNVRSSLCAYDSCSKKQLTRQLLTADRMLRKAR